MPPFLILEATFWFCLVSKRVFPGARSVKGGTRVRGEKVVGVGVFALRLALYALW